MIISFISMVLSAVCSIIKNHGLDFFHFIAIIFYIMILLELSFSYIVLFESKHCYKRSIKMDDMENDILLKKLLFDFPDFFAE